MPIYEYRCADCGKRTSALLRSFDAPDPPCAICGSAKVHRLVSTFATRRPDDADDFGGMDDMNMDAGMDDGYGDDLSDDWSGAPDDF